MYCNDRTDGIVLRFFFFLFLSPAEISKADGQLYLEMCHKYRDLSDSTVRLIVLKVRLDVSK